MEAHLKNNVRPLAFVLVGTCLGYFFGNAMAGFMVAVLIVGLATLFF